MTAVSGDTFTIEYADDDQQIIVDDFDSTLELIADGTWDSSEPLTIRLTNENLDLNTLDDHDMAFTDDDLAVLTMGDPVTLDNVRSVTTDKVQRRSGCQSQNLCGHAKRDNGLNPR